jgi:dihydrolipoamide dehydrogenase
VTEQQDLVVIGGGAGGFAAAMRAAQLGAKVTVVESTHYGGKCMNLACLPYKFLGHAARLLTQIRRAGPLGIEVGEPKLSMEALQERKDLVISGLRMGTEMALADYGVTLVEGSGKLIAADTVAVGEQRITARNVIVATGSVQAQLPIEGIDLPGVLGTEEAIQLTEVPPRLAIIGSQPPEIEMAQYFKALGSDVTLIESGDQLLPEADRDISQRLGKVLHDEGIAVKRRTEAELIRQDDEGSLVLSLADGKGEVVADKIVAMRRLPNSSGLGLREVKVAMQGGGVLVNERMETSVPHIYAIGDVTVGSMWSHKANAEGFVAAENAMGLSRKMNYKVVPRCLYTWPEVAWVGLTEEEAEAQGMDVDIGKVPMSINPYAILLDQTAGMIKIIACKKYGKIVGAHIMARGAVDLINAMAIALLSEATLSELTALVPMHPAVGEALVDAAMDVEKRSIHLPRSF